MYEIRQANTIAMIEAEQGIQGSFSAVLRDALKVILTTTDFLEDAQDFTVNFIDEEVDGSEQRESNLRWLLQQQDEFKYLQKLAYSINSHSIDKDSSYHDFVSHEQNLVEMVDFLKENKDRNGQYSESVLDLANFIVNSYTSDSE